METVDAAFTNLLRTHIQPLMKSQGYAARRALFWRHRPDADNILVLDLQKSDKSDHLQVVFNVNLGAYAPYLANVVEGTPPPERPPPTIADCHWQERLGWLVPEIEDDRWWVVDRETDVDHLANNLVSLIERNALPALEEAASEIGLRDMLFRGQRSPFVSEPRRLVMLLFLVAKHGPQEEVPRLIGDLERHAKTSTSVSAFAESHIRRVAIMYPDVAYT